MRPTAGPRRTPLSRGTVGAPLKAVCWIRKASPSLLPSTLTWAGNKMCHRWKGTSTPSALAGQLLCECTRGTGALNTPEGIPFLSLICLKVQRRTQGGLHSPSEMRLGRVPEDRYMRWIQNGACLMARKIMFSMSLLVRVMS
jgi:hypothetical protein